MRFINTSPFQPTTTVSGTPNATGPSAVPGIAPVVAMSPQPSETTQAAAPAGVAAAAPVTSHAHTPAATPAAAQSKATTPTSTPTSAPVSEHALTPAAAVEAGLGSIGSSASTFWEWATQRSAAATSHARPWFEFFDLSAFRPVDSGGIAAYAARVKANVPYFLFNYVIFGLILTLLTTITQPLALVGSFCLVFAYFHLFGSTAPEEVPFMGLNLDKNEKVGVLVILALIVFWLTAGAFSIFVTAASSAIFIAVVHGSLRIPPGETRSFV